MKKAFTFLLLFTILIVFSINTFAVVDFNSYPNETSTYDGYPYCLWWNANGYNFDIGIEVSWDPPVDIQIQSVIEYTDGTYELYLNRDYYYFDTGYSQAAKYLIWNSNKQLQAIHFEFHIWENSHYQTTISKSFYY